MNSGNTEALAKHRKEQEFDNGRDDFRYQDSR
jgi:hypothetical protein